MDRFPERGGMRKINPGDAGKDVILERINNGSFERDMPAYFHRYREPVNGGSGMYFISLAGSARQIPYADSLKSTVWEAYVEDGTPKGAGGAGGSAGATAKIPHNLRKSKKFRKSRKSRKQRRA